jgi:hypothetical protein
MMTVTYVPVQIYAQGQPAFRDPVEVLVHNVQTAVCFTVVTSVGVLLYSRYHSA